MGVFVLCFLFHELALDKSKPPTVSGCNVYGDLKFADAIAAPRTTGSCLERLPFLFCIALKSKNGARGVGVQPEMIGCNVESAFIMLKLFDRILHRKATCGRNLVLEAQMTS